MYYLIDNLNVQASICYKAATRLPFHQLIENPWIILNLELSEETLPRLIPLSHPLNLDQDKFYLCLVENMIGKKVLL